MATDSQRQSTSGGLASAPPPPSPSFFFRGHDAPIHSLEFICNNNFLVSGDEAGWIIVWDIWKRRQIYKWQGHTSASILALKAIPIHSTQHHVQNAGSWKTRISTQLDPVYIASHGRDNEIHIWDINDILEKSYRYPGTRIHEESSETKSTLEPIFSLPVNAVNFCKMSILSIEAEPNTEDDQITMQEIQEKASSHESSSLRKDSPFGKTHRQLYIAVPSPTTPKFIDIYDVSKPERTFASVGAEATTPQGDEKKWGSVMAIQMFQAADLSNLAPEDSPNIKLLHMVVGYEDGSVSLYRESLVSPSTQNQKQKQKMEIVWTLKCHREPALDISSDLRFAVSCGSDNVLVKYNLFTSLQGVPEISKTALKSNGIADVKIRSDNKIIGLAGWDGRIRIFSTKTLKPLAVLNHHREGLYCLSFARLPMLDLEKSKSAKGTLVNHAEIVNDDNKDTSSHEEVTGKAEESNDKEASGESSEGSSGYDSDEEDSDFEYMIENRRKCSTRHWISAGVCPSLGGNIDMKSGINQIDSMT
ncbi:Guanine nucleotide binding protein (G protein), beta polypeptide 1-like [Entomortierella beljakovae]|nr:Guanine nucleotide binding protein (G protein), beta polypeptide 1-like [Entomortierella beljakovae]